MPSLTHPLRIAAAVLATSLAPAVARADVDPLPRPTPTAAPAADARLYFNAGARAYAAGKYAAAIRAFEEAYRIEPRPGLVFSIAQAHRRQYFIDKKSDDLLEAIRHYRRYLDLDAEGARRGDTAEALSELEPLASRLSPAETPSAPPVSKPVTQLMISSPIDDVSLVLDGKRAGALPYIAAVSPGVHRVALIAEGYFTYERDVRVLDGSVVPLDVTLQEKPGKVTVRAPEGARVSIDGRFRGVAQAAPVEVAPGRHLVTVTENGHEPFSKEIVVHRDETRGVQATMPSTGQRTTAWILLGAGGTALLAGGGLLVGALVRENSAKSLKVETPEDIRVYNDAAASRDELRTAGIATASAGLGLAAIGLFLFAFDEPRAGAELSEHGTPEPTPAPHQERPGLDLSAAPWFGPSAAGASLIGVFR